VPNLLKAGYGAIVIKGASDVPLYLAIHNNRVYFRDASSLWGVGSCITVQPTTTTSMKLLPAEPLDSATSYQARFLG